MKNMDLGDLQECREKLPNWVVTNYRRATMLLSVAN